jgi:hypothetical protein
MRTIVSNEEKAAVRAEDLAAEKQRKLDLAIANQRNREQQVREAEEAQIRRSQRNAGTLFERVAQAKQRLEGMPAGAFVTLLEQLSDTEREVYLLAETYGKNRQDLLRRFPRPRVATTEAYLQAVNALDEAATPAEDVPPSPEPLVSDDPEVIAKAKAPAKSRAKARTQEA